MKKYTFHHNQEETVIEAENIKDALIEFKKQKPEVKSYTVKS